MHSNYIVFDCEAVAIDGAGDYLEPVSAPAHYKKEEAIAAYVEQGTRDALSKAALDIDLARICAIGTYSQSDDQLVVRICRDEADEAEALQEFWMAMGIKRNLSYRSTLIGYNCLSYDIPLMLRRSLYLGVETPRLQMGKYRHDGIEDLMLSLSFDGAVKYRGLAFYCKRMGIDVPDSTSGKDIAGLVEAGDWAAVEAHCAADVLRTAKLAERIGVIQPQTEAVR